MFGTVFLVIEFQFSPVVGVALSRPDLGSGCRRRFSGLNQSPEVRHRR